LVKLWFAISGIIIQSVRMLARPTGAYMAEKSKFEEMCAAANASNRRWQEYRQRCFDYLARWVELFTDYCESPDEKVQMYKWNGERYDECEFEQAEKGFYTVPGAAVYDSEMNCWVVGVVLRLSRQPGLSANVVYFPLLVGEFEGEPTVRIGFKGEAKLLNFGNTQTLHQSFDSVVDMIKGVYDEARGEGKRGIGFHT
jgi:hypothetical protein